MILILNTCRWKNHLEEKFHHCLFYHTSVDFIEKEPFTFFGFLIIFHEVMSLESFIFDLSDIIPVNVQNMWALLFWIYFN